MFFQEQNNYLKARLYSTCYLGREITWSLILGLFEKHKNTFWPDRWGTDERTRSLFRTEDIETIRHEWTRPIQSNEVCFSQKRPNTLICFAIKRFPTAKFNECTLYIRDKHLNSQDQIDHLLSFVRDLSSLLRADYGFISHIVQEKRQSPVLTPAERLPGIFWANFFGRPYISFFGREQLLATACREVREINDDLILLLTAQTPKDVQLLESDEVVNNVKKYLNRNAFAGPRFPDEPCSVPEFDFSDIRWSGMPELEKSLEEKIQQLQNDLEAKGYELIGKKNGVMQFRGPGKSIVQIDPNNGEISVDLTGDEVL